MITDPDLLGVPSPGQWQSVHWLTPLIKSWQIVVVGGVALLHNVGSGWLTGDGVPFIGPDSGIRFWLYGLGALLGALLLVGILTFIAWRMTRYRLTAEAVELRTGVLFRQHRIAQLDRLQAVDVVQPFLARIFGLARVNVEVAGGTGSAIPLAYLKESDAKELRNHLLAGSAGLAFEHGDAPQAPEHSFLEVPLQRLIVSILLSGSTIMLALFAVAATTLAIADRSLSALLAAGPAALGALGVAWGRFANGFGFRVAVSPDGLRLRHGLIETRSQTVPPGRVQAISVRQPLLWRRLGWWRLDVNIAGYAGSGEGDESVLLPVASRDDALAVLSFIVPDLGCEPGEQPAALVDVALTGSGDEAGFVTSPRAARWFDWFSWRRNGFRITRQVLLIRLGWASRSVIVVPHARTQSLRVSQGPLMRPFGLAHFELHSTPGPVSATIPHLDVAVAADLLRTQSERARYARAASGPERWMRSSDPLDQPTETTQTGGLEQFRLSRDPVQRGDRDGLAGE